MDRKQFIRKEGGAHVRRSLPFRIALFLAVLICVNCICSTAFAAGVYTITDAMSGSAIGQYNSIPVFLINVSNSYDSITIKKGSSYNAAYATEGSSGDLTTTQEAIEFNSQTYNNAKSYFETINFDDTTTQSLNSNCSHLLFRLNKTGKGGGIKGYAIVEWEKGEGISKDELEKAISKAPNTETDTSYYHNNDRYNGKPGDTLTTANGSFWAEMQYSVTVAQTVYDNSNATQTAVDKATATLNAAVAKLIPTTQVNPTELYETVQSATYKSTNELYHAADYTPASWAAYSSAMTTAQTLLDSLFYQAGDEIPGGKAAGDATPINDSTDAEITAAVTDAVSALEDAVDGLYSQSAFETAKEYIPALKTYMSALFRLFDKNSMSAGDYSAGWDTFSAAYDAAKTLYDAQVSYTGASSEKNDYASYTAAFNALYNACYYSLTPAGNVTVSLKYLDTEAARSRDPASANAKSGYIGSVTLSSGCTVGDLLSAAGITPDLTIPINFRVFINGVYVGQYRSSYYSAPSIKLRNGDDVTLVSCEIAQSASDNTIWDVPAQLWQYEEDLRTLTLSLSGGGGTVKAGEEFTVNVTRSDAALGTYTGVSKAAPDMTIFTSGVSADKPVNIPTTVKTNVVTDASGNAALSFYQEGWYIIGAYDLRTDVKGNTDHSVDGTYYSVNSGGLTLVYVEGLNAAELEAARLEYQSKLDTLLAGCNEAEIGSALWPDVTSAYGTAKAAIEHAASLADIRAAYDTAVSAIKAAQKSADSANAAALEQLRAKFIYLPTLAELTAGKLYSSDAGTLAAVFGENGLYSGMSGYQKAQLTTAEAELLTALQEKYAASNNGADLPAVAYSLTLTFDDSDAIRQFPENCPDDYTASGFFAGVGTIYKNRVDNANPGTKIKFYASTNLGYSFDSIASDLEDSYVTSENTNLETYGCVFIMPRHDVIFTVKTVLLSEQESETAAKNEKLIADARTGAIELVTEAFNGYQEDDYTSENWDKLVSAKTNGISAINTAACPIVSGSPDLSAITAARKAALAAMSAIPAKNSGPVPGPGPDRGSAAGKVKIVVENTTFKSAHNGDTPAWTGTLIDGWYKLYDSDTMMTAVLHALNDAGCTWTGTGGTGYDITYLASIITPDGCRNGAGSLGEFDGYSGSGWMGTLNDWFVNESFQAFSVSDGDLENGDEIHVMFTTNLGVDLGGTWNSADTKLDSLSISKGTLVPAFDKDTLSYGLIISGSRASITVTPAAVNKNYLVKTFLNTYNKDAACYKRTESISVQPGDTVYIGCGDRSWPSMNKTGAEAIPYTGTTYTVKVYGSEADYVAAAIASLPAASKITYSNYKTYASLVTQAGSMYKELSSGEQSGLDTSVLTAAEAQIKKFEEIDNVKSLLRNLIGSDSAADAQVKAAKTAIEAADAAYRALSAEQQGYITVGDVANYNKLVERLSKLTSTSASTITGSESIPGSAVIEQAATVSGGTATAIVTEAVITSAIKAVNASGDSAITIIAAATGGASTVQVSIPRASAQSIVKDTGASLVIETKGGSVTISNDALASIASQAAGSTITLTVGQKTAADVTDKTIDTTNAIVAEVTVTSDGKEITEFGGKSIVIDLPVDSAYTAGGSYRVIILSADGRTEATSGKCVEIDGSLYVEVATTHLSTFIVTNTKSMNFTDVKNGDWYYDAVQYVYENGLFAGTTDTAFAPDASMTRAMLVTVLYRLEGKPAVTGTNSFTDVKSGEWYTDAVIWAGANNIVTGYGGGSFGTNDPVTREQMAAILMNYAQYKSCDVTKTAALTGYTDAASIDSWAAAAMQWAVGAGLISGTTTTTLAPAGTATRAEVATILMRFVENVAK